MFRILLLGGAFPPSHPFSGDLAYYVSNTHERFDDMNREVKRFVGLAGTWFLILISQAAVMAQSADEIAKAVLPLPEDLRADATIYVYDENGDRKILRPGRNMVECMPKNPEDGFTRCYNKITADRRDFEAKLKTKKKSQQEITAAMDQATKEGKIKPAPYGVINYRYSDDDKRIKLLWIMSVPNATPEMVGVSTVSQQAAALKGKGLPWMMLPGTPGAHIMIPINNTPLSNHE